MPDREQMLKQQVWTDRAQAMRAAQRRRDAAKKNSKPGMSFNDRMNSIWGIKPKDGPAKSGSKTEPPKKSTPGPSLNDRLNGIWGIKPKDKSAPDKPVAKSNAGNEYARQLEAKAAPSAKKAAERRARTKGLQQVQNTPGPERERLEVRRRERIKNKDYKGKYYGPDEFKGNMNMLRAWRAAGSPDSKKFARSAKAD
jgi:hypothetical protein